MCAGAGYGELGSKQSATSAGFSGIIPIVIYSN
jgi:hypothetical protein